MHTRRIIAALFVLGFALDSSALTIGRPQGNVWIGKPLDLVIPLSVGESEGGGGMCVEADVMQGETRIPDGRITVSLDPGNSPSTPRVHLRSTVAIDEPVVNVSLSAGCQTKSTRSFVLLSDVLPQGGALATAGGSAGQPASSFDSAAPARSSGFAAPPRRNAVTSDAADGSSAAAPARRRVSPPRSNQAVAVKPRPRPAPPKVAAAVAPVAAAAAPAAAPSRPVLQLDPLEPAVAKDAGLKPSPELAPPSADDAAKRAEAIAQWRALASEPESTQREAQRLQALEATLAVLRNQSSETQRALTELRTELALARDSRYRNPLVYGLVAALLLALIAMLLLWRAMRRAREVPAWWLAAEAEREAAAQRKLPRRGEMLDEEPDEDESPADAADMAAARRAQQLAAQVAQDDPPDTSGFGMLEPRMTSPVTAGAAPQRQLSADELVDVQQHAEFFLSLGQHEQAINVLQHHIDANPDTSALAYLDLFKILHDAGRRPQYDRLAENFERAFNAEVPDFDSFGKEGRGLDQYKGVLARIEAIWPAPGTLALIEDLVFRKPGSREEAFDLPAYKELLLLYSVARDAIEPGSDWSPLQAAHDTAPAPIESHSTAQPSTVIMPLTGSGSDPESAAVRDTAPASIFGVIDPKSDQPTTPMPMVELPKFEPPEARPEDVEHVPLSDMPAIDMDLVDFDRTAYETLRAPLEPPAPKAPPAPSTDPNVIDFDPFDPATEAEIAPKPARVIKR